MSIIKKVVVFVMGVVVIGVLSTTIGVITQPKTVTFEILSENTITPGTFNKLNEYIEMVDFGTYINIDFVFNGVTYNGKYTNDVDFIELNFNEKDYIFIYDNDTWIQEDPQNIIVDIGDTFTFKVGTETPFVVKSLLFLTPLILSASLIGFLAFKKGDE